MWSARKERQYNAGVPVRLHQELSSKFVNFYETLCEGYITVDHSFILLFSSFRKYKLANDLKFSIAEVATSSAHSLVGSRPSQLLSVANQVFVCEKFSKIKISESKF
jgi:hypothetical protein